MKSSEFYKQLADNSSNDVVEDFISKIDVESFESEIEKQASHGNDRPNILLPILSGSPESISDDDLYLQRKSYRIAFSRKGFELHSDCTLKDGKINAQVQL